MNRPTRITLLALLSGLTISACTTVPEQLEGEYTNLDPQNTREGDLQTSIRWGGVILETRPESNHTCFEILSRRLEKSMRPADTDKSDGRFIACKPGFYDPEVFEKNREVTVVGKLIHIDVRKVGDFDYNFPVVDIEFMSLWPERRQAIYYNHWGGYSPYYWNYPYYGHRYRYPYW
jgi:outer membrane lipoprotein